jgi:hypothetical protein
MQEFIPGPLEEPYGTVVLTEATSALAVRIVNTEVRMH